MTKMYNTEGLPAFWKGILPPILVETPKRAVKVNIYCLIYKHTNRSLAHVLFMLFLFIKMFFF